MPQPVWNARRRWMGNALPMLAVLPFLGMAVAAWMQNASAFNLEALAWLLGAAAAGWLAVNFLGLSGNRQMRERLCRRLSQMQSPPPASAIFVGMATPAFRSLVDPHEDIGFLSWADDRLVFYGENRRIELPREAIRTVRLRPNVHSWVSLGGWVSVEGVLAGRPVALLIEPREMPTLWQNQRLRKRLEREIRAWVATPLGASPPTTRTGRVLSSFPAPEKDD